MKTIEPLISTYDLEATPDEGNIYDFLKGTFWWQRHNIETSGNYSEISQPFSIVIRGKSDWKKLGYDRSNFR